MLFFHIRETDRQTHKGREILYRKQQRIEIECLEKKAVVNYLYFVKLLLKNRYINQRSNH